MSRKRQNKCTVLRSKELRKKMTLPERILWQFLRASTLAGLRFRRQHPVGRYIADFCCVSKKWVVELDGEYHDTIKQEDMERDDFLGEQGFRVLRFTNDQVFDRVEWVLQTIADKLEINWNKSYHECVSGVKFTRKLYNLLAEVKRQREQTDEEPESVFE
jgi:very-short-patch-repair endonuclease